jgi:D-cysteine desulfhydrase
LFAIFIVQTNRSSARLKIEPMSLLPRLSLATWPTPLERAPRLAAALGLHDDDLWIKRDDLTGLAGGGNKIRKLEFTCGAALAAGARTLVTVGVAQSNHARLSAAAAARIGVDLVLILAGERPDHFTGNLALNGMLGAKMVWAGAVDDEALDALAEQEVRRLQEQGVPAALIPFGGSNTVAVHGYIACGEELNQQLPDIDHVFTAVGSGGTWLAWCSRSAPDAYAALTPAQSTTRKTACVDFSPVLMPAPSMRLSTFAATRSGAATRSSPIRSSRA